MANNTYISEREGEQYLENKDFSGGIQQKTTEFLQQPNELNDAQNSRYNTIGAIKPSEGYGQIGNNLTSSITTSTSTSTTSTSTSTSSSTTTSTSTSTTSTSSTTTSTSTSTTTTP